MKSYIIFKSVNNFLKRLRKNKDINELCTKISVVETSNNLNKLDSAILFTTHKCASTFIQKLFTIYATISEYEVIDYATAIWNLGDYTNIKSPYEDL